MAHPPRYPKTDHDTDFPPALKPAGVTPRWVSVLGIIIAIGLVLLMIVLHLGGSVGPGAH